MRIGPWFLQAPGTWTGLRFEVRSLDQLGSLKTEQNSIPTYHQYKNNKKDKIEKKKKKNR